MRTHSIKQLAKIHQEHAAFAFREMSYWLNRMNKGKDRFTIEASKEMAVQEQKIAKYHHLQATLYLNQL